MAFKPKTAVGVEVTCSQVKLVEVTSTAQGMKITDFAVFDRPKDLNNIDTTADPIKEAIVKSGLNTREIYGAVSSPLIEHRTVLLPPMSDREMTAIARREAGKGGETALTNVSFGLDVVGHVVTGDVKKTAALIVTAPYELVRKQARTMEGLGLSLRGLTTVPIALYHAILQGKPYDEEDTIAFINVGAESTCIIMVNDNSLLFSREFSLASIPEAIEANYTERLTVEVKRSILYFKQRYRGKAVSKGVLCGDLQGPQKTPAAAPSDADLRDLAGLLAEELNIGVEVFGASYGLEEISLPQEKTHDFHDLLPSLTVPMGLAIAGLRQSRVNLLLQEGPLRGKGPWVGNAVLGIAAGAALLMLLGSYIWVSVSNRNARSTRLATLKTLESLRPELERVNAIKEERNEHAARLRLVEKLDSGILTEGGWYKTLREISWLVPDDIVFDSLEAKQGKDRRCLITIGVSAPSRDRFKAFLSQLQYISSLSVLNTRSGVRVLGGKTINQVTRYEIECEMRR